MGTPQSSHTLSTTTDTDRTEVIPAISLTGSRIDRLRLLDEGIAELRRRRRALAGDEPLRLGGHEGPSRAIGSPEWPWLAAGILIGALFVVLLLVAFSWA